MRGRHAVGPEIAERLDGSDLACTRLRVLLETITGEKRVTEACEELGICGQLFERLRHRAMQAAAESLELKPAGRPARTTSAEEARIAELQERIAELEAELQAATVRAELAATLPRLNGKKR